jgi:hypothetical protein
MTDDIVERLRMWPATEGKDAFSSAHVEALMREAADEIERLRAAMSDKQALSPSEPLSQEQANVLKEAWEQGQQGQGQRVRTLVDAASNEHRAVGGYVKFPGEGAYGAAP